MKEAGRDAGVFTGLDFFLKKGGGLQTKGASGGARPLFVGLEGYEDGRRTVTDRGFIRAGGFRAAGFVCFRRCDNI